MEDKKQNFSILYFTDSRKIKMQLNHTKKITCAGYAKGAVTDQMCFAKFCAEDFLLDNDP